MIYIKQYKWAGSWGPFKIKIPCGECSVTESIIQAVIDEDFENYKHLINFKIENWLDSWWKIIYKGGYHAPIVTLNGKIIFQGAVIDRGLFASYIRQELVKYVKEPDEGCVIYSKKNCKYCLQAKDYLRGKGISYIEKDIVDDPMAALEIFKFTKIHIGEKTPVTTPQIWIEGKYIGGYENLIEQIK